MANQFQRDKMRWLNAINYDCALSAMTCRVAFVIADHLNKVSGDAWPSERRISNRLCISTKTVQRSIKELEKAGWLNVTRSKGRKNSNRYRPRFEKLKPNKAEGDKPDEKYGHSRPPNTDTRVRQTFLKTPSRIYLEGASEGKVSLRDQGAYEQRLIARLGTNGRQILEELAAEDLQSLTMLCWAEKSGKLTDELLNSVVTRFQAHVAQRKS